MLIKPTIYFAAGATAALLLKPILYISFGFSLGVYYSSLPQSEKEKYGLERATNFIRTMLR